MISGGRVARPAGSQIVISASFSQTLPDPVAVGWTSLAASVVGLANTVEAGTDMTRTGHSYPRVYLVGWPVMVTQGVCGVGVVSVKIVKNACSCS